MEFIEATAFSKHVYDYLSEEEYLGLQSFLLQYPQAGKVVLAVSEKCVGQSQIKEKAAACE